MVHIIKRVLAGALNICKNLFSILHNKYFLGVNFLVLAILALYFVFFIRAEDFVFFPSARPLIFETFTDREKSGNSDAELEVIADSLLDFKFELGEADPNPYAGINFNFKEKTELDVSKYNAVAIEFTNTDLNHMSMFLNVEDTNVINKTHPRATRRMLSDLFVNVNKARQTTKISFDEMESPNWWYEELNQSKKEFGDPDWSRLSSISISNGINSEANQFHDFKVHRIYFVRDYTTDLFILSSIQFFCLLVSGVYFIIQSKSKKAFVTPKKIEISYKPVIQERHQELLRKDFLSYIHEHFSNSELSLPMVAEQTGETPKYISDSIAEQFHCNFKTYINNIRISESKRLLQLMEYNINEVAYMVGFNSPGHFNRVFKNYTNTTPSEFVNSCKSGDLVFC